MKKIILVACLALAAAVVAPIASASAATEFVGACVIKGEATFGEELSRTTPKANTYNFQSGAGTTCSGAVRENGVVVETVVNAEASASVKGSGLLSCALSTSGLTPGEGSLTVNGRTATFTGFNFVGLGVNVTFAVVGGESAASGTASFATDTKGVAECTLGPKGPLALKFTAAAKGKLG